MTIATFFLYLINLINFVLVPAIMALAFLVLVWGIYTSFISNAADKDKREKGKKFIMYGIAGLVIMFTFWGIVRLLVDSGGFGGARRPDIPNALEGLGLPGSRPTTPGAGAGQTPGTLPSTGDRQVCVAAGRNDCTPTQCAVGTTDGRTDCETKQCETVQDCAGNYNGSLPAGQEFQCTGGQCRINFN
jgi:hypothetical protein